MEYKNKHIIENEKVENIMEHFIEKEPGENVIEKEPGENVIEKEPGENVIEKEKNNIIYGYNIKTQSWHCIECGVDMGTCNPRQLCGKWVCYLNPDV